MAKLELDSLIIQGYFVCLVTRPDYDASCDASHSKRQPLPDTSPHIDECKIVST